MNLILIVGKNGTDIGMRKDATPIFGMLIPNHLGNSMTLITAAYSNGTDFILQPVDGSQIDAVTEFTLTTESGASITLAWDGVNGNYAGAVGAIGPALESHFGGTLNMVLNIVIPFEESEKEEKPKKKRRKKKAE